MSITDGWDEANDAALVLISMAIGFTLGALLVGLLWWLL